jgi:hypothetical protein
LSPEELQLLAILADDEKTWRRDQYKELLKEASALRRSGAKVIDLTNIFEKVQTTVFTDDCCHVNQLGNELLVNSMLGPIIGAVKKQNVSKAALK